jgi:acetyl-CoA carboxylase carboxyltransferase component
VLALPTAKIAVMGAEAAVNAVYANKIAALPADEREAFVAAKRTEYDLDIDVVRLASELVIDGIVDPEDLRAELVRRYAALRGKDRTFSRRRHGITPV